MRYWQSVPARPPILSGALLMLSGCSLVYGQGDDVGPGAGYCALPLPRSSGAAAAGVRYCFAEIDDVDANSSLIPMDEVGAPWDVQAGRGYSAGDSLDVPDALMAWIDLDVPSVDEKDAGDSLLASIREANALSLELVVSRNEAEQVPGISHGRLAEIWTLDSPDGNRLEFGVGASARSNCSERGDYLTLRNGDDIPNCAVSNVALYKAPVHVVATLGGVAPGFYVNGRYFEVLPEDPAFAAPTSWPSDGQHIVSVFNRYTPDREFRGKLYFLGVYAHELTAGQVEDRADRIGLLEAPGS